VRQRVACVCGRPQNGAAAMQRAAWPSTWQAEERRPAVSSCRALVLRAPTHPSTRAATRQRPIAPAAAMHWNRSVSSSARCLHVNLSGLNLPWGRRQRQRRQGRAGAWTQAHTPAHVAAAAGPAMRPCCVAAMPAARACAVHTAHTPAHLFVLARAECELVLIAAQQHALDVRVARKGVRVCEHERALWVLRVHRAGRDAEDALVGLVPRVLGDDVARERVGRLELRLGLAAQDGVHAASPTQLWCAS
jgi:hypothetical protein